MTHPLLFVVGQSATAAYLAPLWRRWLAGRSKVDWRILAAPSAAKRLAAEAIEGLVWREVDSEDVADLVRALDGWRPDSLILSASSAPLERASIRFAERERLPVARIVDTWYGYRARLAWNGDDIYLPDRLLVIDEVARRQAVTEGLPEAIVEVVGQPAWESVPRLAPADRRDVLFVSQPIARYYGQSLGYTEASVWQILADVVAGHPELFRRVLFARHPDDDMPPPDDPRVEVIGNGAARLAEVGLVVGMFSSLLLDALLAGRTVVSLQPDLVAPHHDWFGGVDAIPVVHDAAGLVGLLRSGPASIDDLRLRLAGSCDRLERFCDSFGTATATVH